MTSKSTVDGIIWVDIGDVGANRYRYMHCPGVYFILRDYDCTTSEENVPKLALGVQSAEITRLEVDEKHGSWTLSEISTAVRINTPEDLHRSTGEFDADATPDSAPCPITSNDIFGSYCVFASLDVDK